MMFCKPWEKLSAESVWVLCCLDGNLAIAIYLTMNRYDVFGPIGYWNTFTDLQTAMHQAEQEFDVRILEDKLINLL